MRSFIPLLVAVLMAGTFGARAQPVVRQDAHVAADSPEAWAMKYFAGSTIMTGFGATPVLRAGDWIATLDVGHIPTLDEAQQRVGFGGAKSEDLNKTPVFGRVRFGVGMPGAWLAELGFTPPVTLNGAQPRDLISVALGHRLFERGPYTLSMRAFGQHGRVRGDITCPATLAGIADRDRNPFGCQASSKDQFALHDYGIELVSGWRLGPWHAHAGVGFVRTELAVQVDALTFDVRDRSRLVSRGGMPFVTVGGSNDLDARWNVGLEVLFVPLRVRRGFDAQPQSDPLASVRVQVRYRIGPVR
jgi:hypothetical protein